MLSITLDPGLIDVAARLAIAGGLGALIGMEREMRGHPAGFRTLTVLGAASALIMILSERVADGRDFHDSGRIAAQVISGMGFLGAGVILRTGLTVHGLTTASVLWAVAALGLTVGAGLIPEAVLCAAFILFALLVLSPVESSLLRSVKRRALDVTAAPRPGLVESLAEALRSHGYRVEKLIVTEYTTEEWTIHLVVRTTSAGGKIDAAAVLLDVNGVKGVFQESDNE
ncbi:MAG: MgtC/SapB family protein [Planctomycetota bacterium]|jgi:putative Mg2+ transporter-C (MgtC) family protein|nr:MgtC/SapB family protein [Planctomycetota bacterium]MDP6941188.1 MgtC/SapB family protein [Planctomycetota bacterium]